jgi:hypothetical protein
MDAETILRDLLFSTEDEAKRIRKHNAPTNDKADYLNQGKIEALENVSQYIRKCQEEE